MRAASRGSRGALESKRRPHIYILTRGNGMKRLALLISAAALLGGGVCNAAGFTDNKDGTVAAGTSLVWQKGGTPKLSWDEASKYCEELELGGRSDWRIPTREELLSLVDKTRKDPAINIRIFPETEPNVYWTSSRQDKEFWTVGFSDGDEFIFDSLDYKWHTRCVAEDKVEPFVQSLLNWAGAWSQKNADAYLAFYGPDFKDEKFKDRKDWESSRRKKIEKPKWIKVELSEVKVTSQKEDQVELELIQSYRAHGYADRVKKAMTLVKTGDDWKIVDEKTLEVLK